MPFAEAGNTDIPDPRAEHGRDTRLPGAEVLHLHTTRPAPGVVALEATGILDINSATRFAEALREYFSATDRTMVLDLSALSFLSTHGVVALLEAGHRALMHRAHLVLITGNRIVDRLLDVLDVADRFTYSATVEAAIGTTIGAPGPPPAEIAATGSGPAHAGTAEEGVAAGRHGPTTATVRTEAP